MKRTRFTATMVDGSKLVILAYTAQDVRDFYSARCVAVSRGDYRKAARNAERAVYGGFTIDQEALAAAIQLLDIKQPVKIRFHSRVGGTNGNHRLRAWGHDIMIKSYLAAEQASSTLWHELKHARQSDGHTLESWRAVKAEQRRYSYAVRPIEREARALSAEMADCPLTR